MDHWKKSETTIIFSCDEIQLVNSQGWSGVKETLIMLVKLMIGIAFLIARLDSEPMRTRICVT